MEAFVHFRNVDRFIEALASESEPERRIRLEELLFEELSRYGSPQDRIHEAEHLIAGGLERIRHQREITSRLMSQGEDSGAARIRLFNLIRTQSLFEAFRASLAGGPDRRALV